MLLVTVAGSTITVAGVVFSITIVTLSLASQQFGLRLLRNFMRDLGNQIVLGVYMASFVYCMMIIRAIPGDEATIVPSFSVAAGLLMELLGLGFLICFIHHVSDSIQVDTVLATIADEAEHSVALLNPHHPAATWRRSINARRARRHRRRVMAAAAPRADGAAAELAQNLQEGVVPVFSRRTGHVQRHRPRRTPRPRRGARCRRRDPSPPRRLHLARSSTGVGPFAIHDRPRGTARMGKLLHHRDAPDSHAGSGFRHQPPGRDRGARALAGDQRSVHRPDVHRSARRAARASCPAAISRAVSPRPSRGRTCPHAHLLLRGIRIAKPRPPQKIRRRTPDPHRACAPQAVRCGPARDPPRGSDGPRRSCRALSLRLPRRASPRHGADRGILESL